MNSIQNRAKEIILDELIQNSVDSEDDVKYQFERSYMKKGHDFGEKENEFYHSVNCTNDIYQTNAKSSPSSRF